VRLWPWLVHGSLAFSLALVPLAALAEAQGHRPRLALSDTMGSFRFVDARGSVDRPITVWYYRPRELNPDARIVFVMHGASRTAEMARDSSLRDKAEPISVRTSMRHPSNCRRQALSAERCAIRSAVGCFASSY
jgi:hypothetical protein